MSPAVWSEPSLLGIPAVEATEVWRCDARQLRDTLHQREVRQPLQNELPVRLVNF